MVVRYAVVNSSSLTPERILAVEEKSADPRLFDLEGVRDFEFPAIWRTKLRPGIMYSEQLLKEPAKQANTPHASFDPSSATKFVATIEFLVSELPEGFSIAVTDFGEDAQYEESGTVGGIMGLVQAGKFELETTYIVAGR